MGLMPSSKVVGIILVIAVSSVVVLSWMINLFDFSSHLADFYAIILAELVVLVPVIVVWTFNREIRYWIWLQNAPHLVVEKAQLDSDMVIQEICVQVRKGPPVCRKANVVFVSVKNTKGRIARDIMAETNQGGYNTDMVFITPTGKTSLTVPPVDFIEDEAVRQDDASFVSAVLNDVERDKFVLKSIKSLAPPPKGRDRKFVLCFALENESNRVWIPHNTKIWQWMPCDFPLVVKFYVEDIEVGRGAFRITGNDWKTLSAEPVTGDDARGSLS